MSISEDHFLFLKGNWTIDRSTNGFGYMLGSASFLPLSGDLPTLAYQETGVFVTAQGENLNFYREYIYSLNKGIIEVHFASQQKKQGFFHALTFSSSNVATATHPCRDDLYRATYTFLNENSFSLAYDIKGPKKHIRIETVFKRKESEETN